VNAVRLGGRGALGVDAVRLEVNVLRLGWTRCAWVNVLAWDDGCAWVT